MGRTDCELYTYRLAISCETDFAALCIKSRETSSHLALDKILSMLIQCMKPSSSIAIMQPIQSSDVPLALCSDWHGARCRKCGVELEWVFGGLIVQHQRLMFAFSTVGMHVDLHFGSGFCLMWGAM